MPDTQIHSPTYNGIPIPDMIPVNRIISAFANEIDWGKVEHYRELIRYAEGLLPHCIPEIKGYPDHICEQDVEEGKTFISGELVTEKHIGMPVWYVTDGHHRSISASAEGLPYLNTTMDETTFTDYSELQAWRNLH